jgi:hypothetical protein
MGVREDVARVLGVVQGLKQATVSEEASIRTRSVCRGEVDAHVAVRVGEDAYGYRYLGRGILRHSTALGDPPCWPQEGDGVRFPPP